MVITMLDIKRGRPTLKPNYALIPVTTTDNVDEWNAVFMDYSQRGYPLIEWTPSGGISLTNWRYMGFGVKSYKWGAEITAIDATGAFRLQFRSKLNDVDQSGDISGKQAFFAFRDALRARGIELKDYEITNGWDVKQTIQPPLIKICNPAFVDLTFTDVYHLDLGSAYPAGAMDYHPEFEPIFRDWYNRRAERAIYKQYLNLLIGTMQSSIIHFRHADISKHAIEWTRERVLAEAEHVRQSGGMVIMFNTDGLWCKGGEPSEDVHDIGHFRVDIRAAKFRAASAGKYEYITADTGEYVARVRGRTAWDDCKPRSEWEWGDIYKDKASLSKRLRLTNNGLEAVLINDETGVII